MNWKLLTFALVGCLVVLPVNSSADEPPKILSTEVNEFEEWRKAVNEVLERINAYVPAPIGQDVQYWQTKRNEYAYGREVPTEAAYSPFRYFTFGSLPRAGRPEKTIAPQPRNVDEGMMIDAIQHEIRWQGGPRLPHAFGHEHRVTD